MIAENIYGLMFLSCGCRPVTDKGSRGFATSTISGAPTPSGAVSAVRTGTCGKSSGLSVADAVCDGCGIRFDTDVWMEIGNSQGED